MKNKMDHKQCSIICLVLCLAVIGTAGMMFSGCGFGTVAEPTPSPTEIPTPTPVRYESGLGKVVISEVMSKNKATLRDGDGDFPDWIEIENLTDSDLNLYDWRLTDGNTEWHFPEFTLYGKSRAVICLSKKDKTDNGELHSSFAISEGDTVTLLDRNAETVDSCFIENDKSDWSLVRNEDGAWELCAWPTPGYENTASGYEYSGTGRTVTGPLVINEVCVENFADLQIQNFGYADWVEIRNISEEAVDLSDYYLSDDSGMLKQYNMHGLLSAGSVVIVYCDKDAASYKGDFMMAPFSLNSENDRLYLSNAAGELLDYTALKHIPAGVTYGRVEGQEGFFYLDERTPGKTNSGGLRRVAEKPEAVGNDGVFNNVQSVTVELEADGDIYYTLDCSDPTTESTKYTGPFKLERTTVVRAINVEQGAVVSDPLTLNYIINEDHTLPVVSLVCSDSRFHGVYVNGQKDVEMEASFSFYEVPDETTGSGNTGSVTAGCGVKLNGASSLVLAKKNLSIRFRGCYGAETLDYDFYGGGVTEFSSLVLRAGQDQNNTIVRNEACYQLASEFTDKVLVPRYRYCILYLNGSYNGIYAVIEKPNEAFAASWLGVSKDSVELPEANVYTNDPLYQEVFSYVYENDMSQSENYEHICQLLDVDSLIDWTLVQGFLANYDLASGNLRYARSKEGDGKWRLVYYDLDCAFSSAGFIMYNVLSFDNQPSNLNRMLLKNDTYREKMLNRASEGFSSVLTQAHMLEILDRLCEEVEPEVARDKKYSGMDPENWQYHLDCLKALIEDNNWEKTAINNLCELLNVTSEERTKYFGDK